MKFIGKFVFLFFLKTIHLFSSDSTVISMNIGFGNYEAFHLGIKYYINNRNIIGSNVGFDEWILISGRYYIINIEYDRSVFNKNISVTGFGKWYWNNKIYYWYQEDEFYRWDALALFTGINRNFFLSNKSYFSIDFGPAFNIVLRNQRKTYQKVGWPYHVFPNFRIQYNFRIK